VRATGARLAARAGEGPAVEVTASLAGPARLVLVAAVDEADLARAQHGLAQRGIEGLAQQRRQHGETLRRHGLALGQVEAPLGLGLEWAKARMDAHLVGTPGVGRSILATHQPGEDPAAPGVARAHFAARDACWTAMAQLATGEREAARDVIKFLSHTQDVTGKVLTRASTSGLAQYDAADPTALYLLLAARYGAWTGDLDFLRRWWPPFLRAYRWCLAADTDGDGIPEHRRAGRIWSERGSGGAPAVDISLAATWVAALEGLEPVASALGFHDLASELEDRATAAREVTLRRFRVEQGWAYAVRPDGTRVRQRGDQLAVPTILGVVSPESAAQWLDTRAGETSTSGWVDLAEAKAGRLDAALRDLHSTAARAVRRHRGDFGGALPAALYALGVVEGLWGVEPDGFAAAVRVSPWLPPGWSALALERLRVGRSAISLELRRHAEGTTVLVRRTHGPRLHLTLGLRGVAVDAIAVDETPLGGIVARFEVDAEHTVTFQHDHLAATRPAT
jgi:glycogen debranching enzyme